MKTSTTHIELLSGMPPEKVHELTFLWFGLPGPLLMNLGWSPGFWKTKERNDRMGESDVNQDQFSTPNHQVC